MAALHRLLCLAVPAMLLIASPHPSQAQDASSDQAKVLLTQAAEQFESLNFTTAKATFLQVDGKYLAAPDKTALESYLARVDDAIRKQAAGAEAYRAGEDALGAGDLAKAKQGFSTAAASEYLPASKRQQATDQLALVDRKASVAASKGGIGEALLAQADQPAGNEKDASSQHMMDSVKARREQVKQLLAQGDQAMAQGNYKQAEDLYDRALTLQPDLEEAKQKLAQARQHTAGGNQPILNRFLDEITRRRQQADFQFQEALDRARAALKPKDHELDKEDFQAANDAVQQAKDVLLASKRLYTAEQYSDRLAQAESLQKEVESRQNAWERKHATRISKEIDDANRVRIRQEEQQRQDKVSTLTARAKTLMAEQSYEEALGLVGEILKHDSENSFAAGSRGMLEQLVFLRKETKVDSTRSHEEQYSLLDLREAEIPWWKIVNYPEDWKELSATRAPFGVLAEESGKDREVKAKLQQILKEVRFNKVEFRRVVEWLREVGGVNIDVTWTAMAEGADQRPIDLLLTNVSFEKVLELVLGQAGTLDARLSYVIDQGVIQISTRENLNQNATVTNYDIRDLIYTITTVPEPPSYGLGVINPASGGSGGGGTGGTGGGGGGGGIFGGGAGGGAGRRTAEETPTRKQLVEAITKLIQETVDPTSWRPNGEIGAVQEMNGILIIRQTAANHKEIHSLIGKLREAKAIQIAIEARFVRVSTGFLNSIGVDLDFYFNLGSRLGSNGPQATMAQDPFTGARVPTKAAPSGWGRSPAGTNYVTPIPVTQNSNTFGGLSKDSKILSGTSIGSAITSSALTVFGTFLDDIQVDFLLEATQAHASTRSLAAPRLTLFNGTSAYIQVQTSKAYVADLTPVISENAVAFDIEIGEVGTGTYLWVYATVSADRRYVTISVAPTVTNLIDLAWFPYDPTVGARPPSDQAFVQLPEVEVQTLKTTVSVPDGGTLLIGGQKLSAQIEQEVGVPVLSKIPIINRFFDNRRQVRDEQTLLILIKPKILIQNEQEATAFP